MSSVTRFLRQIPTGMQYYAAPALATLAGAACEFVPTAANYVGNYPPGYVAPASAALQAAIQTITVGLPAGSLPIIRDMGKTVFAETASSVANAQVGTGLGVKGSFRQVQLLLPQPITNTQGFIGGVNGNVGGVYGGSPDAYSPYLTFYLPETVCGILASPATLASIGGALGGQL
jgi:hypothetical protein